MTEYTTETDPFLVTNRNLSKVKEELEATRAALDWLMNERWTLVHAFTMGRTMQGDVPAQIDPILKACRLRVLGW
jgi:hypothetical protein